MKLWCLALSFMAAFNWACGSSSGGGTPPVLSLGADGGSGATPPVQDPADGGASSAALGPVLTGGDSGKRVALGADQLLTVKLDAQPSTGHTWGVEGIDTGVLVLAGREQETGS